MSRVQFLVGLQRVSHSASHYVLTRWAGRWIELAIRVIWSAHIAPEAKIDRTARFGHNGLAVIIHPLCDIGPECLIGPHVILGGRAPIIGAPTIEHSVIIHAGAKVFGPIKIGHGSVIGANAVVTTDIPPRSLVVGIPAQIRKTDIEINDYR